MLPHVFRDKVFSFTQEKGLFCSPCHVLVAVSGGADSMALLHTLLNWPEAGIRVSVVHIHHGLRGEFADRDEQFVRDFCEKQNVQLIVYHEDIAVYAKKHRLSLEEAGRQVRYERFDEARTALGADLVATAHTASDRSETTLMRIIRGTGIDGLVGITALRGHICRPLLSCTRADVERYCEECQIPYVTDETNDDMAFSRNRIRHQVLPMLRELNPAVDDALLRLANHADEDSDWLRLIANEQLHNAKVPFGYKTKAFTEQQPAIMRRMIMLMMRDAGVPNIEESHIMAIEHAIFCGKGDVHLSGGYIFCVSQGVASVRCDNDDRVPKPISVVSTSMVENIGEHHFNLRVVDVDHRFVNNLFANMCLDYDKIEGNLQIRCRQDGDVIHPVNRGVGKSLKKLMNECGIPTFVRDSYPVLCDERGVIMVPAYAVDERVKVTDNTKHLLVWQWADVTT